MQVVWDSVVEEAYGNEKGLLAGVKVKNLKTGVWPGPRSKTSSASEVGRGAARVWWFSSWPLYCRTGGGLRGIGSFKGRGRPVKRALSPAPPACPCLQAKSPTCPFPAFSLPSAMSQPPSSSTARWEAACAWQLCRCLGLARLWRRELMPTYELLGSLRLFAALLLLLL